MYVCMFCVLSFLSPSLSPSPSLQCLSHLEDRLLELNERGILLANNLMDHGNDVDLGEVLPTTFKGLRCVCVCVSLCL